MVWPRSLVFLLVLAISLSSAASAQRSGFRLPANYFTRFDAIQPVVSAGEGYGVRYFPLPLATDLRLSLVRAPGYWDYALSTRLNETTLVAGKFGNVPTFEVTRSPYTGAQFGAVVRLGGFSNFSGGYGVGFWQGRARWLNTVGVAFRGDARAAYLQSEVNASYGRSFGPVNRPVNTLVAANVRAAVFPETRQAQESLDLYAAVNTTPQPGLLLDAWHFERLVSGTVPLPEFALGRVQQSALNATYRLKSGWPAPALGLGALRGRLVRDWRAGTTDVYGDVFLRSDALGSMVGTSVGYRVSPGGAGGVWLISLTSLPK